MMVNFLKYSTFSILFFLLAGNAMNGQIKDEEVRVQRKYEPRIKAVKQKKATPGDSVLVQKTPKKEVTYSPQDVEPISDFEAQQITPSLLPMRKKKYFKNYLRTGLGSPGNFLAEGYYSYSLDEDKEVGLSFDHFSINEVSNEIPFDSDAATTSAEVFYQSNFDLMDLKTSVSYNRQKVNYFGLGDPDGFTFTEEPDLKQVYSKIGVNIDAVNFKGFVQGDAHLSSYFLSDRLDVEESFVGIDFDLNKGRIKEFGLLSGLEFAVDVEGQISYSNTSFSDYIDNAYRYFTSGIKPTFRLQSETARLELGGEFIYQNETTSNDNKFYIYPHIELQYNFANFLQVYGGINGSLQQNLYNDLRQENPFLFSLQNITPTNTKFKTFGGIKGSYSRFLKYDFKGFFAVADDMVFYTKTIDALGVRNYGLINSFRAAHADGNLFGGEANIDLVGFDQWGLSLSARYTYFDLNNLNDNFGRPNLSGEVKGYYKLLEDKLLLNSELYFVGERPNLNYTKVNVLIPVRENLDSYLDLNFGAEYAITDNWLGFMQINNILNTEYELYSDYQVQGIQFMLGARYRFGKLD